MEQLPARGITLGSSYASSTAEALPIAALVPLLPETSDESTRLVGQRVDALVIAFALDVSSGFQDELVERQSIADLAGTAQLLVDDLPFAMKRSRRRDAMTFENADLLGQFDERAAGGWQLEIVIRATYLATHPLEDAIALTRRVASGFGIVTGTRLRRFDLAVDFVGFPLRKDDVERILTRAKIASFIPQAKDIGEVRSEYSKTTCVEHRDANHQITGFSVAPGNPLMARIYDKTTELSQQGRDEKRSIEHAIWRKNGWDGVAPVTRVEFQHRGTFLDEIDLRNVDDLSSKLDAVWQRDVRWLRFVDPNSATRLSRCALDPRWEAVSRVVFKHQSDPVLRKRVRGGATTEHVFGATQSRLAAIGRISRIALGTTEDGEFRDERKFAYAMTTEEALAWLDGHVRNTFDEAARDVARSLRKNPDPRDAVLRFIAKRNSTVARFSSADDPPDIA